jgi:DNA-binding protein WhiA
MTVNAAMRQINAIEYLKSTTGLSILPENLKELAELRIENPEASLSELVNLYDKDISKSGVKHRLDKIISIAQEHKEKSVK